MISAIISTYNRDRFLNGLFESILEQTISKDDYEIVIVNNNSTDQTDHLCKHFIATHPEINCSYFIEKQQGLSFGRNRGISESKGELVTFLDDDAVIAPDFFEKTITFFESHPAVNAIGGKILLKYMETKPDWYNPYLASLLGFFDPGNEEKIFSGKNYFRGSNMSFRKGIFEKYDAFNTSLGRVGKSLFGNEEKELFYRFKSKGEEMWYVPSAIVYHLVPIERTTNDFVRKQALGTGASQRKHAEVQGKAHLVIAIISELIKWCATMILSFGYLLRFKFAVATMLVKFRWWVSKGFLTKK